MPWGTDKAVAQRRLENYLLRQTLPLELSRLEKKQLRGQQVEAAHAGGSQPGSRGGEPASRRRQGHAPDTDGEPGQGAQSSVACRINMLRNQLRDLVEPFPEEDVCVPWAHRRRRKGTSRREATEGQPDSIPGRCFAALECLVVILFWLLGIRMRAVSFRAQFVTTPSGKRLEACSLLNLASVSEDEPDPPQMPSIGVDELNIDLSL